MARAKPTAAAAETPDEPAYAGTEEGPLEGETGKAAATHALGLLTVVVGPLLLYFLFRRKASPWLRAHLDEAVNYHILLVAAFIVVVIALVFLSQVTVAVTILAIVLLLLFAAHVVFGVLGIVQSARGKAFHYPLDVRIVR